MPGVFISYRREDAPGHAGRVYDRVRARFGVDGVFMDVTAIDAGADFVEAIEQAVGSCDVLLAIIGPQWAGAADSAGRRRLENPNDFIRLEIAGALKRHVRVVPVLVDGARLPVAADLPDDLQPLLRRNAAELRDARWDADIEQLIASLERIVKPRVEPWQLEAAPASGGRVRLFAALAIVAVSVVAAMTLGPRACATAPDTTTTAVTPPAAATPSAAAAQPPAATPERPSPRGTERPPRPTGPRPAPSGAPKVTVPDVVGRSLPDARDILRLAGVDVARILYRDDRTQAIDLVVEQSDVPASAGRPQAVVLTAVARTAVVIHHRSEDADVAQRLLGALAANGATAGLTIRTLALSAVRPDSIARVTYSDRALAGTAAGIARDANAWLAQNDPGRPQLEVAVFDKVGSRSIVIGLPDRGTTTSSSSAAPLPDVRGLSVGEARRMLSAVGVTTFGYKWSDDGSRRPLVVFGQDELPARAGGRTVGLQVGAKGTLWVYHVENDAPVVQRFARALQGNLNMYGILVHLERQRAVRPEMVGKVASDDAALAKEAGTIATFTSNWLATELGRTIRIERVTEKVGPRRLTFGFPSLP